MAFVTFFCTQIKPSHPVFGFAPPPASSNADSAHPSSAPSLTTENPFASSHITPPHESSLPVASPFGPVASSTEEHEPTIAPSHAQENPFATPASEPSSGHDEAPHVETVHHSAQVEEHDTTTENPFMSSPETHPESHLDTEPMSHSEEHAEPHVTQKSLPVTTPSHEHLSTVKRTASIPTLAIIPGHSAKLAPLTGNEAEMHYVIQDKKYSSYLTTTVIHGKTEQTITIPATIHEGSFTIFKAEGTGVHPQSLQPAYHVTITPTEMEGTQFPEEQTSSAVEKLKMLEDQYLATMQEHFKGFMHDLRNVISEASKTGESLALPQPPVLEKITTHPPVTLLLGETKILSSFAGGSAQSANPAIVGVTLSFKGSKEKPEWTVSLTAHKAGETTITYSTGTETFEQPVFVKGTTETETATEEKTKPSKDLEEKHTSVVPYLAEHPQGPLIPLEQEGALASFLRADENLPGEATAEEKESTESALKTPTEEVTTSDDESNDSLASDLEEQDKQEQEEPAAEHDQVPSHEVNEEEK